MNLNPIDILIIIFVLSIGLLGYNNGLVKSIGKLINLSVSSVLANLIISNLALQFQFLKQTFGVIYLSTYLLIFLILILLIGFIIEFLFEQIDEIEIDKSADIAVSTVIGIVKGFIGIALILFIFDTTPVQQKSKDLIYDKIEQETLLAKPCNNLKELLYK